VRGPLPTRQTASLAAFQDAFVAALMAPLSGAALPAAMQGIASQPGFDVYRNTVVSACIDALVAAYPVVTRLVGEEWMRAACAVYVSGALPNSPVLLEYGATFPAFLAGFEPAGELPYLADIARLDRAWTEAHAAPEATALDLADLAAFDSITVQSCLIGLHPSVRWHWSERHPVWTIWRRQREPGLDPDDAIDWKGEGALVVRRDGVVEAIGLDRGGCAFAGACEAGATLATCVAAALAADPACDAARLLRSLFRCGAIVPGEVRP